MDYPDHSFFRDRGPSYYQRADFPPAGVFVPHIMIALVKKMNAWFVAMVLCVVYVVGVGLAGVIYLLTPWKNEQLDSYWITDPENQVSGDLTSPY